MSIHQKIAHKTFRLSLFNITILEALIAQTEKYAYFMPWQSALGHVVSSSTSQEERKNKAKFDTWA